MLGDNAYGKSGIRLVKLARRGDRHEIRDLTVAVRFEGHFEAAHDDGDNSAVLPTDTMKNTVYALAKDHRLDAIEPFALDLAAHFLENNPPRLSRRDRDLRATVGAPRRAEPWRIPTPSAARARSGSSPGSRGSAGRRRRRLASKRGSPTSRS